MRISLPTLFIVSFDDLLVYNITACIPHVKNHTNDTVKSPIVLAFRVQPIPRNGWHFLPPINGTNLLFAGIWYNNIIRDHELTTADIVELQQSLGKNLIVNNHLQAVRPNIWSPPQPPQADVVLTSVTLLSTMHFCIFKRNETLDVLLLPHKGTNMYSFVNLSKGHICPCLFPSIDAAIADLDDRQKRGLILGYDIIA